MVRCGDRLHRGYLDGCSSAQALGQTKMNFADAFKYVVGEEGTLSTDRQDPGNWTSGQVGVGIFKGTKYGVSAAAYPLLDIAGLSLADAQSLAKREYWDKLAGDVLPYGTALCLFDFGYNSGIEESIRVAQRALGLGVVDGIQGPVTHHALMTTPVNIFVPAFTRYRIYAYEQMAGYERYGNDWVARAYKTERVALQ